MNLMILGAVAAATGPIDRPQFLQNYNWSQFPAAWFGANATNWESEAQLDEIGRYSMAILGWQHLDNLTGWHDVVFTQLTQASILKARHPNLPVFVYAGFGWAFGQNAGSWAIMNDEKYRDFFLQSTNGPVFTQTNCQQGHVSPASTGGRCLGYFWNFANASARTYFIENIVAPLAYAPMIDGVFFDAFNYGYDIPEVRPWGKATVNVPNCSASGGCELLLAGTLDVATRTAELLNSHNKVPMFANPASFVKPPKQKIWLDEARLVAALEDTKWFTYYESARAENYMSANLLENMLKEAHLGVAAGVHTYYKTNTTTGQVEDPTTHIAAFKLVQGNNFFYFGSTGWWDNSFSWTDLYDRASKCGNPLTNATTSGEIHTRKFEGCQVTLDCSNPQNCVGSLKF